MVTQNELFEAPVEAKGAILADDVGSPLWIHTLQLDAL